MKYKTSHDTKQCVKRIIFLTRYLWISSPQTAMSRTSKNSYCATTLSLCDIFSMYEFVTLLDKSAFIWFGMQLTLCLNCYIMFKSNIDSVSETSSYWWLWNLEHLDRRSSSEKSVASAAAAAAQLLRSPGAFPIPFFIITYFHFNTSLPTRFHFTQQGPVIHLSTQNALVLLDVTKMHRCQRLEWFWYRFLIKSWLTRSSYRKKRIKSPAARLVGSGSPGARESRLFFTVSMLNTELLQTCRVIRRIVLTLAVVNALGSESQIVMLQQTQFDAGLVLQSMSKEQAPIYSNDVIELSNGFLRQNYFKFVCLLTNDCR